MRPWTFLNLGVAALALASAGCLAYHPYPLPTAPDLTRVPAVRSPTASVDVPGLAPHAVPARGLDETTVMTLAVLNDPDLKAARLQAGVANAQLFQAGLLPDPQIGASFAKSALQYGGTLSLSQDIQAILTRGAAQAAARASARQVNLHILWLEAQVAERARELFIQEHMDAQLEQVLGSQQKILEQNFRRERSAMERDDATADAVAADSALLASAQTAVRQVQLDKNATRHGLNALLGLQPDAELHLIGPVRMQTFSRAALEHAIAELPRRRADLLALQAGYESQEETLRRAILAQFPGLSAGIDFERDPVEGANAFGPEVTLTLPIFNRNRGQIAIAQATRAVLHQQYQAQMDAATSQADQVWEASQILAGEIGDVDRQLPVLQQTARSAAQGLREKNLNAAVYVTSQSAWLSKQVEQIRLQASLDHARSALSTLLGLPFAPPTP